MPTKLESIKRIINPKEEFIVIIGAGVSRPSPSNLPTGINFIDSFYNFLISRDTQAEFESKIEVLKNHQSLRFENIMSLIQKNTAVGIQPLLDCYRECDSFNEYHRLLATLGSYGHVIATTNFDSLIERACIACGIVPEPIIYDEDYKKSHSTESIYKLHGSVEKYDSKSDSWSDSLDSVRITLEQVGVQGYGLATSIQKRQFLSENFRNKNLVFIGYSGYDDFDIVPILLNTKSKQKILWLNYDPDDSSIYSGADISRTPQQFGKSGQIISELMNKGLRGKNACFIIKADSWPFLSSLVRVLGCSHQDSDKLQAGDPVDSDSYFANKLDSIFPDREIVRMMKGALLWAIEDYETALIILGPLLQSFNDASDLYLRSKILYEIALCHYNQTPPNLKAALRYSKESFDIDLARQFTCVYLSGDLLARIYRGLGQLDSTNRLYETLVAMSAKGRSNHYAKYHHAIVYGNYSNHLFKTGQVDQSLQFADKSLSLFKEIGDFDGMIKSTIRISIILMESGQVDQAIHRLQEMERIANDLDSFQELCSLNNELGIAFRYKSDPKTAIAYHNKAAQFAKMVGSQVELSRQYYNMAVCECQRGDLSAAVDLNNRSLEIRNGLQDGEKKWSSLSENFQLYGSVYSRTKKYRLAKEYYDKSNKFAEKIEYARVICDNYCNLLYVSIQLDGTDEVKLLTDKLRYLLTEKYPDAGMWERVEEQTMLYWAMKRGN